MKKLSKKVVFVSTLKGSLWGGSEELWNLTAIEFLKNGFHVSILIYDFGYLNDKLFYLKNLGAKIYTRPRKSNLIVRILNKMKLFNEFLNPYKVLLKINPDIVIVTDGATYYTANDEQFYFILTKYFKKNYSIICQGNHQYHIPNNRELAMNLFNNAKDVFFVSDNNREECFHQLASRLDNTYVIQNPLNISQNEFIPYPSIDNKIHIAIVGRLNIEDKGQDLVIKMLCSEYWRSSNCQFHLYGKGHDENYLSKLINYYKVTDLIKLEGEKDIKSIWSKCHILLLPSLIEGTSLAMLEALFLGRICVVSKVGGSNEWIKDGINGYLIESSTLSLIEEKLKFVLNDIENWESIRFNARNMFLNKADLNPGFTLYNHLISEINFIY